MQKPLTVCNKKKKKKKRKKHGKCFRRWEYQTTFPDSWEICMQVKKQQLEPDTEQ